MPIASSLVAMPGAGSDGHYAARAFAPLADALGVPLIAVDPGPSGVVASYLAALDEAAADGPVLAAGVSIGACVAVHWAATAGVSCAGVVAASPPWPAGGSDVGPSPAAAAALATVADIEANGVDAAVARMRASSPDWLGAELGRSWTALRTHLAAHLREAATTTLPSVDDLRSPTVPVAVVTVADDPIHPAQVGADWAREMSVAAPAVVPFDVWAADPGTIGRAAARLFGVAEA